MGEEGDALKAGGHALPLTQDLFPHILPVIHRQVSTNHAHSLLAQNLKAKTCRPKPA